MAKEQFSAVEEALYHSLGIPTSPPEAFQAGVAAHFTENFFDRDDAVIGGEVYDAVRTSFFPENSEQTVVPTAAEWKTGLVDFGVRTYQTLKPQLNGSQDIAAAKLGSTLVTLLRMTKPSSEIGATVNGGITEEGIVLGRLADRRKLLWDYSTALTETVVFPNEE